MVATESISHVGSVPFVGCDASESPRGSFLDFRIGPATGSNWGSQKIANGQNISATRGWVTKNTCSFIVDENCLRSYKWELLSQWIAKAMCLA